MRSSLRLFVILLVAVLGASPVLAVRPTIEFLDVQPGLYTFSGLCSFDVLGELRGVGNKEKLATFYGSSGEVTFQVLTGVNQWQFTNAETGKSIFINASGPGRFFVQPGTDVVRIESGGVSFLFAPNGTGGLPAFALTRGRIVAALDPATFTVLHLVEQNGTVQDVCALLQ